MRKTGASLTVPSRVAISPNIASNRAQCSGLTVTIKRECDSANNAAAALKLLNGARSISAPKPVPKAHSANATAKPPSDRS